MEPAAPDREPNLPNRWLEHAYKNDGTAVRVVLDERVGKTVYVREAEPADGSNLPLIALYEGDIIVVAVAIPSITHHTISTAGDSAGLLYSQRIVPAGREPGAVFARTLRYCEPDPGRWVHVRPGEQLKFAPGSIIRELANIETLEKDAGKGEAPLTPVLFTWLFGGSGHDDATVRYLLSAARRLDQAATLFIQIGQDRIQLQDDEMQAPAARRVFFALLGKVEVAVVALSRVADMIVNASDLIGTPATVPDVITASLRSLTEIRNAYEHIEDRALGRSRKKPDHDALTIFNYRSLIDHDRITYGAHSLDLIEQVPHLISACRAYLKDVAGNAWAPNKVAIAAQANSKSWIGIDVLER